MTLPRNHIRTRLSVMFAGITYTNDSQTFLKKHLQIRECNNKAIYVRKQVIHMYMETEAI